MRTAARAGRESEKTALVSRELFLRNFQLSTEEPTFPIIGKLALEVTCMELAQSRQHHLTLDGVESCMRVRCPSTEESNVLHSG